jgi:uncharacterized protein DUF4190
MSSAVGQDDVATYGSGPRAGRVVGVRNGMGTAALIVGILAVLLCWTLVGGVVLGLLAVVFGAVGRGRVKRGEATNGGAAVAGVILGLLGVVLAVVLVVVGATFVFHHKKAINNLESCLNNATSQAQKNSCNQQFRTSVSGSS